MTGKKTAEMDRWLEEKIRANVYDIFRTVLSVAEKLLARDTTGYWRVKPE